MPPTEEDLAWLRSTFHPIPKPALPDDCIEYSLYILSTSLDRSNDSELRLRLRDIQKHATDLQKRCLKDYIWQRQGFSLELNKEDGLSFLRGRTEYGDSVEDEWVVVWVLKELTKSFSELWVKVTDSDGEFLLIEASGTLPAWLEPEVAENRVWINNGQLRIIKPAANSRSSKRTDEKLSLLQAREIILNEPQRIMHSTSMEEEAFFRLRNYPKQITENMHHAVITIPRTIAFLLHQKPAYISPAVEAFYLRDPIALKPLQSKDNMDKMSFPPEDFVSVSVKFPRVAYAQVKSQDFPPPAVFAGAMPSRTESKSYARAETGMKVACGFEMLVSDSQFQDKPAVREMKMLLEDLKSGDEALPTTSEIETWEQYEDDDKWLDINFDDLDNELDGRRKGQTSAGKKGTFGDKAAQENLQRIVKQFEQFLNDDKAGLDGAGMFDEDSSDDDDDEEDDIDDLEDDDDQGEDKDASFNEDDFTKMMQEMMGMPPEVMKEIMSGKLGPGAQDPANRAGLRQPAAGTGRIIEGGLDSELSDEGEDEDGGEDMQAFMKQMEAELRGTGVLDLNPPASSSKRGKQAAAIKGAATSGSNEIEEVDRDSDVDELSSDDEDIDNEIDVNLARNLLESLKSQAGTAGPGGNLMGMLGLGMLPRDENDPGGEAGPSGYSKGRSKKE
ncbi:uncharacterized protein A1O9_00824 [Exophiala aquamarina CBS 119918]|uniref:Regulatory factor Sgt1 n=1 Tax=Exophiala aquamarina CBS 119918 TaxID=1182545 RepID=A0A072PSL5_9EURO|nr:uncharacterized protein A1O9_00824 [Exophiala aquamarina CBS 119918]KEF62851.1 hypothetical protein A1O9_00824 [Exophiala aquamarina CBS 119918]